MAFDFTCPARPRERGIVLPLPASVSAVRMWMRSGHRAWIEQREIIVQTPLFCPGFSAPAGDIEYGSKDLPAYFLNAGRAAGDPPGIHIDKVRPPLGESCACGDFEDWSHGQAVGRTLSRGENMHVHGGRQLQRAADEIAGGGSGKNQAL